MALAPTKLMCAAVAVNACLCSCACVMVSAGGFLVLMLAMLQGAAAFDGQPGSQLLLCGALQVGCTRDSNPWKVPVWGLKGVWQCCCDRLAGCLFQSTQGAMPVRRIWCATDAADGNMVPLQFEPCSKTAVVHPRWTVYMQAALLRAC
jgi:hypothetical protein